MNWFNSLDSYNYTVPFDMDVIFRRGNPSGSFLINNFQLIWAIFLFSLLDLFLLIVFGLFSLCFKGKKLFKDIWGLYHKQFHFKVYLFIVVEAYLFLLITALAELYGDFEWFTYIPSYLIAMVFAFVLLTVIFLVPVVYKKY